MFGYGGSSNAASHHRNSNHSSASNSNESLSAASPVTHFPPTNGKTKRRLRISVGTDPSNPADRQIIYVNDDLHPVPLKSEHFVGRIVVRADNWDNGVNPTQAEIQRAAGIGVQKPHPANPSKAAPYSSHVAPLSPVNTPPQVPLDTPANPNGSIQNGLSVNTRPDLAQGAPDMFVTPALDDKEMTAHSAKVLTTKRQTGNGSIATVTVSSAPLPFGGGTSTVTPTVVAAAPMTTIIPAPIVAYGPASPPDDARSLAAASTSKTAGSSVTSFEDPNENQELAPLKTTPYFQGRRRLFSFQIEGRFTKTWTGDDLWWGTRMHGKLKLPPGSDLALRFAQTLDPGLQADLHHPTDPWCLSPMLCAMNVIHIAPAPLLGPPGQHHKSLAYVQTAEGSGLHLFGRRSEARSVSPRLRSPHPSNPSMHQKGASHGTERGHSRGASSNSYLGAHATHSRVPSQTRQSEESPGHVMPLPPPALQNSSFTSLSGSENGTPGAHHHGPPGAADGFASGHNSTTLLPADAFDDAVFEGEYGEEEPRVVDSLTERIPHSQAAMAEAEIRHQIKSLENTYGVGAKAQLVDAMLPPYRLGGAEALEEANFLLMKSGRDMAAETRKKFFLKQDRRRDFLITPDQVISADFYNRFLLLSQMKVSLSGFNVSLDDYWHGEPLYYLACTRDMSTTFFYVMMELVDDSPMS